MAEEQRGIRKALTSFLRNYESHEVVEYLYKHSFVQYKALLEELKISKNALSDVMKVLVKARRVEGIRQGKYSEFHKTFRQALKIDV